MGSERQVKRPTSTPKAAQRRKLSNITNLPSWQESVEEPAPLPSIFAKRTKDLELQNMELQKEGQQLRSQLSAQVSHIEKLAAQNEEIIQHYYSHYKELEQTRQELKLLQHEYTQMTTAYRINKTELQSKLEEANESRTQLQSKLEEANERIIQLMEQKDQECRKRPPPSTQKVKQRKSRRSSTLTRQAAVYSNENSPVKCTRVEETTTTETTTTSYQRSLSTSGRPLRKAVETVASYKEPPLNTKMRRPF